MASTSTDKAQKIKSSDDLLLELDKERKDGLYGFIALGAIIIVAGWLGFHDSKDGLIEWRTLWLLLGCWGAFQQWANKAVRAIVMAIKESSRQDIGGT